MVTRQTSTLNYLGGPAQMITKNEENSKRYEASPPHLTVAKYTKRNIPDARGNCHSTSTNQDAMVALVGPVWRQLLSLCLHGGLL